MILKQHSFYFIALVIILSLGFDTAAHAQFSLNNLFFNITESVSGLPILLTVFGYLLGALFAALGVLSLMKSVIDNGQTPMRRGWAFLIVGGMLFALPIMFEAMANTFRGDGAAGAGTDANPFDLLGLLGINGAVGFIGETFIVMNDIFARITEGTGSITVLISVFSFLMALVIGFIGILKIKEHVDNPDQVKMSEAVVRLLLAGALIALPAILSAGSSLFGSTDDAGITSIILGTDILNAGETPGSDCDVDSSKLGGVLCQLTRSTILLPALLSFISYILGIILIFAALLKIRDHALGLNNVTIWDGIMRLIAGGAFIALPVMVYAVRSSLMDDAMIGRTGGASKVTSFNSSAVTSCDAGLDSILICFMGDLLGPMNTVINVFGIIAGVIFIMIGISRLTKSMQEGAKGPMGIGTMMTFVTGAALLAAGSLLKTFSSSLFANPTARTFAVLQYTDGMTAEELTHVHNVIAAILMFLAIIGFISFVRGIFILRGVAEGDQQSSFMAASTHMVGGALALNLGPLLGALQATLGITQYGIAFS